MTESSSPQYSPEGSFAASSDHEGVLRASTPSSSSARTKLAAAFGSAALVLIVATVSLLSIQASQHSLDRLTHAYAVRAEIREVRQALVDAETGQRGYILSGDGAYLAPYERGRTEFRAHLAELRRLSGRNTETLEHVEALADLKLAELAKTISVREFAGADAAIEIVRTNRGEAVMAEFRARLNEIEAQEEQVLAERAADYERWLRITTGIVGGGSVLAFALAVLVNLGIRKEMAERERSFETIAEQADRLRAQAEALAANEVRLAHQLEEEQSLTEELRSTNEALDMRMRDAAAANSAKDRLVVQLAKSNSDLDQFAYVASHDLKAPLRGIANLSEWLEEDLADAMTDKAREQLRLLRGRVHRMEGLIEGILEYSRAGRSSEADEPVDTRALVEDTVELMAPSHDVTITIAPDLPTVMTPKIFLQQIFINLVGNALKHARRDGAKVEIGASEVGKNWEFFVRDNGPGIEPKFHDRIFGIFQTLASRDKVEGTGIGLAVVKKLVESRGGRIWVESALGAGATFRFTLPQAPLNAKEMPHER